MAFSTGSLAVVFFIIGMLIFLSIPVVVTYTSRALFARRFERLVRQGHVVPILQRNDKKDDSNVVRRVTPQSLVEVWVSNEPSGSCSSHDQSNWKPIGASCIAKEEDLLVTDAVLATKQEKMVAKEFLKTLRVPPKDRSNTEQRSAEELSGEIRSCIMILMPSSSRRQSQEGHCVEKRTRRSAVVSSTVTEEWIASEKTLSLRDTELMRDGDDETQVNLHHFELGITEQYFGLSSEIMELLSDGQESTVLLEDLSDRNMAPVGPVHYTIVYAGGRPYLVPTRSGNALLPTRIRIY